jgi:hypothetical protein
LEALLEHAGDSAAVARDVVAVIALFTVVANAVAAPRDECAELAGGGAVIPRGDATTIGAPVIGVVVAVIASFAGIESTVAAFGIDDPRARTTRAVGSGAAETRFDGSAVGSATVPIAGCTELVADPCTIARGIAGDPVGAVQTVVAAFVTDHPSVAANDRGRTFAALGRALVELLDATQSIASVARDCVAVIAFF